MNKPKTIKELIEAYEFYKSMKGTNSAMANEIVQMRSIKETLKEKIILIENELAVVTWEDIEETF